jgi:SAM-dependent methyltransferase
MCDVSVSYHSCDFDYDTWAREASEKYTLPPKCDTTHFDDSTDADAEEQQHWNSFFRNHKSGNFFRPRNYLYAEFEKWLELPTDLDTEELGSIRIMEVGCGHGCSMYPLLKRMPILTEYIATDYSANALTILRENIACSVEKRIKTAIWDVTLPPDYSHPYFQPSNHILCIFALSAVEPGRHLSAFCNMASLLKPGGCILFRDYGLHDMTMYRHLKRRSENLFVRSDRTLAYYFDLDYLRSLANSVGLIVVELEYATIEVRNRKMTNCMKRVFVHAVLQKRHIDENVTSS